ncbi:MAG TPA: hypothetical protein DIT28_00020 [Oxalobacteraceae bacterium]|nr:hypothetical protein [Oxalobacteraceae bacterium]
MTLTNTPFPDAVRPAAETRRQELDTPVIDGSPRFGRWLIVPAIVGLLMGLLTFASVAFYS